MRVVFPVDVDKDEARLLGAFMEAILAERKRAHAKHGETSMEQAPPLDPWRGLILGEEALECGKALNDNRHGDTYLFERIVSEPQPEPVPKELGIGGAVVDKLDVELIQTAAMAYTWWANRRGHRLSALLHAYVPWRPTIPEEDPHGQAQPEAPGPTGAGVVQPEGRQAGGQAGDGQAGLPGEEPAQAAQPPTPVEAISVERDLGDASITKVEHAWNHEPSRWPPS